MHHFSHVYKLHNVFVCLPQHDFYLRCKQLHELLLWNAYNHELDPITPPMNLALYGISWLNLVFIGMIWIPVRFQWVNFLLLGCYDLKMPEKISVVEGDVLITFSGSGF